MMFSAPDASPMAKTRTRSHPLRIAILIAALIALSLVALQQYTWLSVCFAGEKLAICTDGQKISGSWYGRVGTVEAQLSMQGWRFDWPSREEHWPIHLNLGTPSWIVSGQDHYFVWPHAWTVMLAAAALIWPATSAWQAARRRRRGACLSCGYDRHGLAAVVACPECGVLPDPAPTHEGDWHPPLARGVLVGGVGLVSLAVGGWVLLAFTHPWVGRDAWGHTAAVQIGPHRVGLAWLPKRKWYTVPESSSSAEAFAVHQLPDPLMTWGWMREVNARSWAVEVPLWAVAATGLGLTAGSVLLRRRRR